MFHSKIISIVDLLQLLFVCSCSWFCGVSSSGRIRLHIDSLINTQAILNDGTCCSNNGTLTDVSAAPPSCVGVCATRVHVCLKPYSQSLHPSQLKNATNCPYGFGVSEIRHKSSLNSQDGLNIDVPFNFKWPTFFVLAVDVRHVDNSTNQRQADRLITRSLDAVSFERTNQKSFTHKDPKYEQIEIGYTVRIMCDTNYYGHDCATYCKALDKKWGHYTCGSDGSKKCLNGWTGSNCTTPVCEPECQADQGTCVQPNVCKCKDGYRGATCSECIPYEGCKHGHCTKKYECKCEEKWGGRLCNVDLDYCAHHPDTCQNNGICVSQGVCALHEVCNYTCQCQHGYTGHNCEQSLDPCASGPCLNGGQCYVKTGSLYECVCPQTHTGAHCEQIVLSDRVVTPNSYEIVSEPKTPSNYHLTRAASTCEHNGVTHTEGSTWTIDDCRTCKCENGLVDCTRTARCSIANCLHQSLGGHVTRRCPVGQVCRAIHQSTCISPPCTSELYGLCVPTSWLQTAPRHAANCLRDIDNVKHQSVGHPTSMWCDRLYVRIDVGLLPQGSTLEQFCQQLGLLLLSRHLTEYNVDCAMMGTTKDWVQIDLVSMGNRWPVTGLREILTASFQSATITTAFPLISSVVAVRNRWHQQEWSMNNGKHAQHTATPNANTDSSASPALVYLSLIVLVLICVFLFALLVCAVYKKRRFFQLGPDKDSLHLNNHFINNRLNVPHQAASNHYEKEPDRNMKVYKIDTTGSARENDYATIEDYWHTTTTTTNNNNNNVLHNNTHTNSDTKLNTFPRLQPPGRDQELRRSKVAISDEQLANSNCAPQTKCQHTTITNGFQSQNRTITTDVNPVVVL